MLTELVVESDKSILDAVKQIDLNGKGIVFVTEHRKIIGLVTDGDVRRALIDGVSIRDSVSDICNKDFVQLHCSEQVEVIQSKLNSKIKIIPLVDDFGNVVDFASTYRLKRTPVLEPFLGGNELEYVTDCVKTNWISSQGKYVTKFEKAVADYTGASHVLAVSNGTVALHLALVALGIGPGDEVIVPDITFGATLNAIILAGAEPVIVDVDSKTWNISPSIIKEAITQKTKAIMPVHIYGVPCDMLSIRAIADTHELLIVEDCAEALGAKERGRHVGTFGDAGTFSFFGNKVITCGEGGAIIFKRKEAFERAKVLRDHGMTPDKRYWHEHVGFNYRLTNLQAAIGCAQLEQISDFRAKRKKIFKWYSSHLLSKGYFDTQTVDSENQSVSYWLFTVLLKQNLYVSRDMLIEKLSKLGVDTRPIFYPMSNMPAFSRYTKLLNGESKTISEQGISLPTSVYLSEDDIIQISKAVLDTIEFANDVEAQVAHG